MVHSDLTLRFLAQIIITLLLATTYGKKFDDPYLHDGQEGEALKDILRYNDEILSGARNIFVSKQLSTEALSGLLAQEAYQDDFANIPSISDGAAFECYISPSIKGCRPAWFTQRFRLSSLFGLHSRGILHQYGVRPMCSIFPANKTLK